MGDFMHVAIWHKCSEEMPPKSVGDVLLTWNGQYIGKELYIGGQFQCLKPQLITHWMELPSPPEDV